MTESTTTVERPSTSPPIDPRILKRRVEVRRHEGRKRLHRLIAIGAVVALAAIGFGITRSPLLDVDRIEVAGNVHTPTAVVLQQLGFGRHAAMTDLDLSRARQQLLLLPWVESVSVQRSWPSTIRVVVHERAAIAAVPVPQGGFAFVDSSGRVLEIDPTTPPGIVVLDGVATAGAPGTSITSGATDAQKVADALRVAGALGPMITAQVGGIAVDDRGVVLELLQGGRVVLGSPDDLGSKLVAVSTVLDQVDLSDVCALDVRVPSAPSLTRGAPCL